MLTIVSSKIVTAYKFDKETPNMRLKGISHYRIVAKTGPEHPFPGTVIQNTFQLREKALKFYKEMSQTIPDAKLLAIMADGEVMDVTPSVFKLPKSDEEQEVIDIPDRDIPDTLF